MGDAARRAYFRRTTPGQRLDDGLRLADEYVERLLTKVEVPHDASPEERARIQFQALRRANA